MPVGGPQGHAKVTFPQLKAVEVDEAQRSIAHIARFGIPHNTYDLEWLAVAVERNVLSDGIALAEKVADQRLAEDRIEYFNWDWVLTYRHDELYHPHQDELSQIEID